MARAKGPDLCIFCEVSPCECGKPAKKATPRKMSNPTPHVTPAVSPSVGATDNQMVRVREPVSLEQAAEVYALQNIAAAGLMRPDDRRKYMAQLSIQLTVEERAGVWRRGLSG